MTSKHLLKLYLMQLLQDNLPEEYIKSNVTKEGEPGEELLVDEASVWKRILDYRIIKYLKPQNILETHAGLGVASELYSIASPDSNIVSCKHFETDIPKDTVFDYIDIDPYGQPYTAIDYSLPQSNNDTVWSITNGEILQVSRNLRGVKLKSQYKGKDSYKWVEEIYIPYMEKTLNSTCRFYYIFPTSVRAIFSNGELPKELFNKCPVYMSYISKYAMNKKES